jgi:predicted metalloprotease with PDZ domain
MEQKQPTRTKWLTVRMSEEEYQAVEALSRQTTCGSLSEYARKTLMDKAVILRYRNQSLDDFMAAMLQLQKELRAIGANFNQVVRRLHTLKHIPDIQQWILLNEQEKTRLTRQIETISTTIQNAYQLWSRD